MLQAYGLHLVRQVQSLKKYKPRVPMSPKAIGALGDKSSFPDVFGPW